MPKSKKIDRRFTDPRSSGSKTMKGSKVSTVPLPRQRSKIMR